MAFVLFGDDTVVTRQSFWAPLNVWFATAKQKRQQRRALKALLTLDNVLLSDMGLTRGGINQAFVDGNTRILHQHRRAAAQHRSR